jgi:thiol-disulfide isomerase/thioredoxin
VTEPQGSGAGEPPEYAVVRQRRRRTYLIAAAVIAVVAVVSVAVAASSSPSSISGNVDTSHLPSDGPAPALTADGWVNSPPLGAGALKGKVVLYDFWTYSCINCVRTFPYVRSWYDRYRRDGLVVVGVHSPEFDFEKVRANVVGATKRLKVTWPVALDPDMTIWNSFHNQYWPADYVADRQGQLRYSHFGEGDYRNTENVLRKLLGVKASAPRADRNAPAETASGQQVNPETYLGVEHGQIGTQSGLHTYPHTGTETPPNVALQGAWRGADENITSAASGAEIIAGVHAQSVNLVLASASGKPIDAIVMLNGKPVPPKERGASIHVDADGQTVVTVTAPDMYRLVLAPGVVDHELVVEAKEPGLEAYSFTFG